MTSRARACCPRCDYDMQGVVDAWVETCPLEGACSECGLALPWRDVLDPGYGMGRWCVETRRSFAAWPSQVLGTLARAARPRRFWSSIPLNQSIRWRRLLGFVVSLAVLALLLLDLATAAIAVADHRDTQARGATTAVTDLEVFVAAATKPLSARPLAGYVYQRAGGGTLAVNALSAANYVRGLWGRWWSIAAAVLIVPFTTAIAFAALPVARRRAKVRPRHIARVAAYGFIVSLVALLLAVAGSTWSALLHPPIVRPNALHALAVVVLVLGAIVWWHAAAERYLRMERPLVVAVGVAIIGLMIPLAILGVAWYLFGRG
ncbi:MAG: hypothetical protein ACYTF9_05930 [Planctomycetota bacterium]|jgi:hypothetical protein